MNFFSHPIHSANFKQLQNHFASGKVTYHYIIDDAKRAIISKLCRFLEVACIYACMHFVVIIVSMTSLYNLCKELIVQCVTIRASRSVLCKLGHEKEFKISSYGVNVLFYFNWSEWYTEKGKSVNCLIVMLFFLHILLFLMLVTSIITKRVVVRFQNCYSYFLRHLYQNSLASGRLLFLNH